MNRTSIDPCLQASRSPLAHGLAQQLSERCGLAIGARVLVAVSGGADSTALAVLSAALCQRRTPPVIDPVIGHVDHGLRDDSEADARHVQRLADTLGLPHLHRRVTVHQDGHGVAAAARDARYAALAEMAREADAVAVLTAHQADDQAETMLLALSRGSGVQGLAGMSPVRSLDGDLMLARPLLDVPRADLADLCVATGLSSCEDPGNVDPASPRAAIRHEVLPVLERLHPGATKRISALSEELDADSMATGEEGPVRRWRRAALARLAPSACATSIRRAAIAIDAEASGCSRSHWATMADMVRQQTTDPRSMQVTSQLAFRIDSEEAWLEEQPNA
ncbi:MAG: tRNA lysidine(34) synthetase TilS [Phycisphaerales bacterium]|nr:tRNA lysidine(34) synthetase TilS [Phycisphaerales bacterium]